jgi:hypothetical protein
VVAVAAAMGTEEKGAAAERIQWQKKLERRIHSSWGDVFIMNR